MAASVLLASFEFVLSWFFSLIAEIAEDRSEGSLCGVQCLWSNQRSFPLSKSAESFPSGLEDHVPYSFKILHSHTPRNTRTHSYPYKSPSPWIELLISLWSAWKEVRWQGWQGFTKDVSAAFVCVWLSACFDRVFFHQWSNLRMVGKLHKEASHSAARVSCVWSFLLWEKPSSLSLVLLWRRIEGLEGCPLLWNLNLNNNFIERGELSKQDCDAKCSSQYYLCSDLPDTVFLYAVSKSEVSHSFAPIDQCCQHSFYERIPCPKSESS